MVAHRPLHRPQRAEPPTNDVRITARAPPPPRVGPQVQPIVPVDDREQGACAPPSRCTHLAHRADLVVHGGGAPPPAEEAHGTWVRDPALDERDPLGGVQCVEEPADACVEHPARLSPREPDRCRVQRTVLAPPRPGPAGEPENVHLVDRVRPLDEGTLDDLVLHRENTQRPLSAVRLGDEHSPNGARSVPSSLPPRREDVERPPRSRARSAHGPMGPRAAGGPGSPGRAGLPGVAFRLPPRRRHLRATHGFAAQHPARALPCPRFDPHLAARPP